MSEGEVVEQLVQYTNLVLAGTGVFFSVLSIYLAGLNYVLHNESLFTRSAAFVFVSIALAMLAATMVGAEAQHAGLIARLRELDAAGALTAAGKAALHNNERGMNYGVGELTIDEAVVYLVWGAFVFVYLALIYLTFFYSWRPDNVPGRGARRF